MTATSQPRLHTTKTPRERAELVVAEMTLEQEVDQLGGARETMNIYDLDIFVLRELSTCCPLRSRSRTAPSRRP